MHSEHFGISIIEFLAAGKGNGVVRELKARSGATRGGEEWREGVDMVWGGYWDE